MPSPKYVNEAQFHKFTRRVERRLTEMLPQYILKGLPKVQEIIQKEISARIVSQHEVLKLAIKSELKRAINTEFLRGLIKEVVHEEFGRQRPDAINEEIIDGLGTSSGARRELIRRGRN